MIYPITMCLELNLVSTIPVLFQGPHPPPLIDLTHALCVSKVPSSSTLNTGGEGEKQNMQTFLTLLSRAVVQLTVLNVYGSMALGPNKQGSGASEGSRLSGKRFQGSTNNRTPRSIVIGLQPPL